MGKAGGLFREQENSISKGLASKRNTLPTGLPSIPQVQGKGGNPRVPWGQRGSALALTVLLLPVWLALATIAIDVAYIMWVHAGMRAAADLGALAAAQNVDLEKLAEGDPEIIAQDADRDARQWIKDNLQRQRATAPFAERADIRVWVLNGKPGAPLQHPLTGRTITDPTVAVEVSLPARVLLVPRKLGEIPLTVRADASVMGRKS